MRGGDMRGWTLIVAIAVGVSICPVVDAAPGQLQVASAADVHLSGDVGVSTGHGSVITHHARGLDGLHELHGLDGTITIWTWQLATARVAPGVGPTNLTVAQPTRAPTAERFQVVGAMLSLAFDDEAAAFAVVARGGQVEVRGPFASGGRPVQLPTDVGSQGSGPTPGVAWGWREGWLFSGTHGTWTPERGFPAPAQGDLALVGSVALEIDGGNATFTDATGQVHTARLGQWSADGTSVAPIRERSILIFEGTVAQQSSLPLADRWGLAGPDLVWHVDGEARWSGADVTGTANGTAVDGRGVPVLVRGAFDVVPSAPALAGAAGPASYAVSGDLTSVVVAGEPVVRPILTPDRAAGVGLLAAILGAFALAGPRVAAVLYTRISPATVLEHERRRAMYEIVTARPGIHKRELQREVALTWGLFSFHLRILEDGGYVRLAKQGRYSLVYPTTAPSQSGGVAIPHPLARAAFAALPEDGTPVGLLELRRRLGVSNQLLRYHLRHLETRGLVRMEATAPRGSTARRMEPPGS